MAAQTNQNSKTKLGVVDRIILDPISSRMRTRHRLGVYSGYQQKFRFGRSAWTRLLWEIGVRQWPVFIIHVSKEVVPAWAPLHPLRQWFAMSLNIPHRGHFTYHGHFGWPKNFFCLFNVIVFLSPYLVHHQMQQVQSWYQGNFKIKILWWAPSGTFILGQKGPGTTLTLLRPYGHRGMFGPLFPCSVQ